MTNIVVHREILETLNQFDHTKYHQYGTFFIDELRKRNAKLARIDDQVLLESVWFLINHGLVYVDYNRWVDRNCWDLIITEYGRKYIQDSGTSPYDDEGFMDYFLSLVTNVDPAVKFYVKESLNLLNTKHYISSLVNLSLAVENVFNSLLSVYLVALKNASYQEKYEKAELVVLKGTFLQKYKLLEKDFRILGASYFETDLSSSAVYSLFSILNLVRDKNGVPQVFSTEIMNNQRYKAASALHNFPEQCKIIYSLIDILRNKPLPKDITFLSYEKTIY